MVDPEAVDLVKEALRSGKTEQEVITLMKQAGYTDEAVSEVMAEIRNRPGDETARRIAEKSRIPVQNMPKMGPPNLLSQPQIRQMQTGLDKSIIGMFKLSINSFLHPAESAKRIKGNVSMGDAAKIMVVMGLAIALIVSILMLIFMLLLGSMASAATGVNSGAFLGSWAVLTVTLLLAMPVALLLGWIVGMGIFWIGAKILGGTRSYSEFASETAFAQIGTSLASIIITIVEFMIIAMIAASAAATLIEAIASGGSFAILSAFVAFTSTMAIGYAITGLISFVVGIYALYVFVIFIKETMELSTIRAIAAIFLPIVVVFVLGAVISVFLVGLWLSPLTSGPSSHIPSYSLSIQYCDPTSDTLDIRNVGATTINEDFNLISRTTGQTLKSGAVGIVNLVSGEQRTYSVDFDLQQGESYALAALNFAQTPFMCV